MVEKPEEFEKDYCAQLKEIAESLKKDFVGNEIVLEQLNLIIFLNRMTEVKLKSYEKMVESLLKQAEIANATIDTLAGLKE